MRLRIQLVALLAISVLPCSVLAQDQPLAEQSPAALLEILTSDADTFAKAKACQRLAIIGDETCTDALVDLLGDPHLNVYALTALQRIPGDRVDAALLYALQAHQGRNRVGIIHAIGQRQLKTAEAQLNRLYQDETATPEEKQAAIRALGKIGAADRLRPARAESQLESRVIADAKLASQTADEPSVTSTPDWGSAFQAPSDEDFQQALAELRATELSSETGTQIISTLPKLPADRQVLVLNAINSHPDASTTQIDRNGLTSLAELVAAEDLEVAVNAVQTLALAGYYEKADALPDWVDQRPELARVALGSLATAANSSFDHEVTSRLEQLVAGNQSSAESKLTLGLIDYAAERRLSAATPHLLALARARDAAIAAPAIEAAGYTASLDQFEAFLKQVVASASSAAGSAATETAMARASVRLPRHEAATIIGNTLASVDGPTQIWLLSQLPLLGGETALQVVTDAAQSGAETLVDGATRALGEWLSTDVAAPLAELAETLPPGNYRTRALRAYLRVGRQFDLPTAERMELCRHGWELSARDDERLLIIDILKRNPTLEAGEMLVQIASAKDSSSRMLRNQALVALAAVIDKHAESDGPRVRNLLQRVNLSEAPDSIRNQLESALKSPR